MKKYHYLASWDDQTLTRVGEPVVVLGDSNVSQVEVILPSNFLLDPTGAVARMYFLLPGEKESGFETLETAVKDENGDSHVTWTIKHVHSQKSGRLAFSLTLIGDDAQWDSRAAIIPVYESRYQPESEEAEEPYMGRLAALEGSMAAIRGEFTEVQEDLNAKQDALTFDTTPTENSTNPVTSGGVAIALANVTIPVDATLTQSGQAADAKVTGDKIAEIKEDLNAKQDVLTFDSTPIENSQNPVTSGGTFAAIFAAIKESQNMVSTTWAELKALRDNGQLVPGQVYRITDYICTTTQEDTRAVEHPFDIIVMADSETALGEIARACAHDAESAGYYQHAHIEAWELKYSIDNDTNRFAWADEESGHGVVYYLKDDHGNECPYDFKQIQFVRYQITACTVSSLVGRYTALQHGEAITRIDEQNPVWCYTFSYDPESTRGMSDASVMEFNFNAYNITDVSRNIIKPIYSYRGTDEGAGLQIALLNCIVLFGNNCSFNTFGDSCSFNTFGDGCRGNTFGNNCSANTFGNNCNSNTFGGGCSANTFGNNCNSNTFGGGCNANTFGNDCNANTFGNTCRSNTFGDNCSSNTFGNDCSYIDISAGTSSQTKKYYHVLSGVNGSSSSHISITGTGGNNFVTYVGKNSSGELKTWVPADLVQ